MIQNTLNFICEVTKEAGKILKEGYETDFNISEKEGRNNLVTDLDHKSEKHIINRIKKEYPHHRILAEESGYSNIHENENDLWIIDPLDGTVNFAHGIPIFSVSIALQSKGEIIAGAVYNPIIDELFYAAKGHGAFCNGNKIAVSQQSDFSGSLLVTGFPYNVNENPENTLNTFQDIIKHGIPIRRLGSAALDLAYVAKGRFEGFWEVQLKPWDVAAGILIVREAGGSVINYQSGKYNLGDTSIIATNGLIENSLLEVIKKSHGN